MKDKYVVNEGKRDAGASFLPAYYYSPWKEGRTKEEQETLLHAEEMEIADGVEEIGNYTFYGCGNLNPPYGFPKRIGGFLHRMLRLT
ncbi:MAG: hypothetical protein ACLTAF_01930 [Blautia coccoides]